MHVDPLSLASLYLVLAAAAASDVASRRVPNVLCVAVAVLGLGSQAAMAGARAALGAAGVAALVLALLLVPWRRGVLGGGDVKLMAACAAWTGWARLPTFLLATALAGGLVAVATALLAHRHAPPEIEEGAPAVGGAPGVAHLRGVKVPYALAIGAGLAVALQWRVP